MSSVSNPIEFHDDFLGRQAQGFEDGATGLKTKLDEALAALHEDASDPTLLAV